MDDLDQLLAESTKAYKHKATEVLLSNKEILHILKLTLVQTTKKPISQIEQFLKLRSTIQREALILAHQSEFNKQKKLYIDQTYNTRPSSDLLEIMDKMRDGQDWKPISMVEIHTCYTCNNCQSTNNLFNGYYQILQHKMNRDRRQLVKMRKADAQVNDLKLYTLESKVEKCIECTSIPRNSDELLEYKSLLEGVLPL